MSERAARLLCVLLQRNFRHFLYFGHWITLIIKASFFFADVEAAAELGRTLLERNRELETTIRQQEAVLDDQSQEMEVLLNIS